MSLRREGRRRLLLDQGQLRRALLLPDDRVVAALLDAEREFGLRRRGGEPVAVEVLVVVASSSPVDVIDILLARDARRSLSFVFVVVGLVLDDVEEPVVLLLGLGRRTGLLLRRRVPRQRSRLRGVQEPVLLHLVVLPALRAMVVRHGTHVHATGGAQDLDAEMPRAGRDLAPGALLLGLVRPVQQAWISPGTTGTGHRRRGHRRLLADLLQLHVAQQAHHVVHAPVPPMRQASHGLRWPERQLALLHHQLRRRGTDARRGGGRLPLPRAPGQEAVGVLQWDLEAARAEAGHLLALDELERREVVDGEVGLQHEQHHEPARRGRHAERREQRHGAVAHRQPPAVHRPGAPHQGPGDGGAYHGPGPEAGHKGHPRAVVP
mmetsp:Transcript_9761/g.21480  ORF Transcript_9761/g.21480 Transcript_9761/m.21480 type:complete len:378 (+) Transcript_9761:206-1339(+)